MSYIEVDCECKNVEYSEYSREWEDLDGNEAIEHKCSVCTNSFLCGEEHVCPPEWQMWCPEFPKDDLGTRETADDYHCETAEEAAEWWASYNDWSRADMFTGGRLWDICVIRKNASQKEKPLKFRVGTDPSENGLSTYERAYIAKRIYDYVDPIVNEDSPIDIIGLPKKVVKLINSYNNNCEFEYSKINVFADIFRKTPEDLLFKIKGFGFESLRSVIEIVEKHKHFVCYEGSEFVSYMKMSYRRKKINEFISELKCSSSNSTKIKKLSNRRMFKIEYSKEKGWNPSKLSQKQLSEIRSQHGWKDPLYTDWSAEKKQIQE